MLREFLASKPQERIVRAVKVFLYYLKSIWLQKFYTAMHKYVIYTAIHAIVSFFKESYA